MIENSARETERRSCAVTLSDMEMFIFPELMYSLVLANIMSPRIWRWREDPWFKGIDKMKPYRRMTRLKQYIMDNYAFNLDLDTWGLTTKEREIQRFEGIIDEDILARSNALFGYEGDKYYFDIDIRTHFGLDKYEGNIIPYWKTETVEAMDAFRFKPNYPAGAGECVSLAALYAAALFLIARIPLKDIYLMATPLHSQDFVDVNEGILTNNRRLVTKNMWFNGTALSGQARRALENERVTIIAHETGCIHTIYRDYTMDPEACKYCMDRLSQYLKAELSQELLGNFLRHSTDIQKCFQLKHQLHGVDHYIAIDRVLAYEHNSPYRLSDNTRDKLMAQIAPEEFVCHPLKSRIVLNDLETFLRDRKIDIDDPESVAALKQQFASDCLNAEIAIESLIRFCHVKPSFPDIESKKHVSGQAPLEIDVEMSREDVVNRLLSIRDDNDMAAMAFHAYRDLSKVEPEPFLIAAIQRNPVSVAESADLDPEAMFARIDEMPDESIYDNAGRLAQPDEVWNYGRGDGLEKAILLATFLRNRAPDDEIEIEVAPHQAVLKSGSIERLFSSGKELAEQKWSIPTGTAQ